MSFDPNKIIEARKNKFKDEDILNSIKRNNPEFADKFKEAEEQGFKAKDILDSYIRTQSDKISPQQAPKENQQQKRFITTDPQEMIGLQDIPDVGLELLRDVGIPVATAFPQLLQNVVGLGKSFGQSAGLKLGDVLREQAGKEPLTEEQRKDVQKIIDEFTTEIPDITESTQKLFDTIFTDRIKLLSENRTGSEKLVKETLKDFGLFVTPQGPLKGMSVLRSLGTSILRNVGSEAIIATGTVDEKNKDAIKFGFDVFSALVGRRDMRKAGGQLLEEAGAPIDDVMWQNNTFPREIAEIRQELAELGGTASKSNRTVIDLIDGILPQVENGTYEATVVTRGVNRLNDVVSENLGNPRTLGKLGRVRAAYQRLAEDIGKQYPEFLRRFNDGNQLVSASYTNDFVTKWLDNKINATILKEIPIVSSLFKIGGRTLTKVLDLPAKLIHQLVVNPRAFKFYRNLITKSLNQQTKGLEADAKALEKELQKDQSQ